jgi:hypothetical protein
MVAVGPGPPTAGAPLAHAHVPHAILDGAVGEEPPRRGSLMTLRQRHNGHAAGGVVPLLLIMLILALVSAAEAQTKKKKCWKLCRKEIAPCIASCRTEVRTCLAGCAELAQPERSQCRQACRKSCRSLCGKPVIGFCKNDPDPTRCSPDRTPPCVDPSTPGCVPPLVGTYAPQLYWNADRNVDRLLTDLDGWAGLDRSEGTGHALAGDFKDIEDPHPTLNVAGPLEALWEKGYADFINLTSERTSAAIANGCCDGAIATWAQEYAGWVARGGGRRAFLAPLQEMNNPLVTYGLDPANYRRAYERIQDIFAQQGVTRDQVWWVFAPVGWSRPSDPPLSAYYPGDDKVDVIAFSAFNFGHCSAMEFKEWQEPEIVFGPYLQIIRHQVSAVKPIFVGQTASTSVGGDKDQWLIDSYRYLAQQNVRAILYFNGDLECDWAVYELGGRQLDGYRTAVASPTTQYVAPSELAPLIR